MPDYNTYPAVDEENLFPDPIIRALAFSDRFDKRFVDATWSKGALPEDTDLNTFITPGLYRISSGIAPKNLPPLSGTSTSASGFLTISNIAGTSATWAIQEYVRYGNYNERWWRISRNTTGAWADWQRLVGAAELDSLLENIRGELDWRKGVLPEGTDLNTFHTAGVYRISTAQPKNMPPFVNPSTAISGFLTVTNIKATNAVWSQQEFVRYGTSFERWWRISSNTTGSWNPWTRIPNEILSEGIKNDLLVQDFTRRRGGIKKVSTGVVSLRFDHGLANFNSKIRPVLERLKLPYSLALCSGQWDRPENVGVTPAMVNSWVTGGLAEIWNHTKDHGSGDNSEKQWKAAIDDGLSELKTQIPAAQIDGFAVPGSSGTSFGGFTNGNTVEQFYETDGGKYLLSKHAVVSGYIPGYRVLDGIVRQGQGHTTIDAASLSSVTTRIKAVQSTNEGLQLMLHPSLVDTEGYATTAVITSIFEYIAAERDAGKLTVLGPYDALLAEYGHEPWSKTPIAKGSLDDIFTPGVYEITSSAGTTGKPTQANTLGELTVMGKSYPVQTYIAWDTVPKMFYRRYISNAWSVWMPMTWRHAYLTSGTDLNTLTTEGSYGFATNGLLNLPETAGATGVLEVRSPSSVVSTQEILDYATGDKWFRRRTAGGVWNVWIKTGSDVQKSALGMFLKSGDDLNTIRTPGTYGFATKGLLNLPDTAGETGVLEVRKPSTLVDIQEILDWTNDDRWSRRSNSSGVWTPWVKVGTNLKKITDRIEVLETRGPGTTVPGPIGDGANVLDVGVHQHLMRETDLRRRLGPISTGDKAAVTLVFDHGTTKFRDIVLPVLREFKIPATLALNGSMMGSEIQSGGLEINSWSTIASWHHSDRIELANHTSTHTNASGYEAIYSEIIGGRIELETNLNDASTTDGTISIDSFIQIGTRTTTIPSGLQADAYDGFGDGLGIDKYYTTVAGRLIVDGHACASGQVPNWSKSYPLDGHIQIGCNGRWIDNGEAGIAETNVMINDAVAKKTRCIVRSHPSYIGTGSNISVPLFESFIASLAARRDAGELVILPFREWNIATL